VGNELKAVNTVILLSESLKALLLSITLL